MSLKKYQTVKAYQHSMFFLYVKHSRHILLCPTTIPVSSSFGQWLCSTTLKATNTHGNHGALKVINPKKLNLVSGFRRDQM